MPKPEPPPGQLCIFVIGMHRSGTSATTGSLAALGIAAPTGTDITRASSDNERGNFESRSLRGFNDRLLQFLGGTWSGPPELQPGWESDHALDIWRARAAESFAQSFPSRPMVWKDPRNCITLPFWRTVVGLPAAAVFVYRDPLEVAGSLQARDGVGMTLGLALWDRYVRSACVNLVGLPTIVAAYNRILDRPSAWIKELGTFLEGIGAPVDTLSAQPAIASLASDLRHQHAPVDRQPGLWESQYEVIEVLRKLDGPHQTWNSPNLGPAPLWVDDVLALRLGADKARRQLADSERLARTSRTFRISRFFGNLRRLNGAAQITSRQEM